MGFLLPYLQITFYYVKNVIKKFEFLRRIRHKQKVGFSLELSNPGIVQLTCRERAREKERLRERERECV